MKPSDARQTPIKPDNGKPQHVPEQVMPRDENPAIRARFKTSDRLISSLDLDFDTLLATAHPNESD